jgi:hypothetical protein
MAATIRLHGVTARVHGGLWRCRDQGLKALLEALPEPTGYQPDGDYALAMAAVSTPGAKLVRNDRRSQACLGGVY